MKTLPLLLALSMTPALAQVQTQTVTFSGEIRNMALNPSAQASIESITTLHLKKLSGVKAELVVHYPETIRAKSVSSVIQANRFIYTSGDDGYNESYTTCRSMLKFEKSTFASYELTMTDLTFGTQVKKTGTFGFKTPAREDESPAAIQNCASRAKSESYSAKDLYAGEIEGELTVPAQDGYYTFSIPLRADASMEMKRTGDVYSLKPMFADPNPNDQVWWMFWQQTYVYNNLKEPYGHTAVGGGTTRAIQIRR